MSVLKNPIGIFDAGIGSFGICETVKKYYPDQDIIWFADRASFPLGKKSPHALFEMGRNSISFLSTLGAKKIIVAANVLTMMVMDRLKDEFPYTDLYGIEPPVKKAATYGDFCVLGVKAMVEDKKLHDFIEAKKPKSIRAFFADASPLIDDLVETGVFVTKPDNAISRVKEYMLALPPEKKNVQVFTLSSTHLPWLRFAFEAACPEKVFLDPAEELVTKMNLPNDGQGRIHALTTENIALSMTQFGLQTMVNLLGYKDIEIKIVPS